MDLFPVTSLRSLGSRQILSFLLMEWFGALWFLESIGASFCTITYELTQSVCSVTSSRIPSPSKEFISCVKDSSRWIGTLLEHVLQACVQVSSEICVVPMEIVLYLQNNQSNVRESAASSMGVFLSQKSYHCEVS